MGIIQCGVHGRQSIMPVCPEVDEGLKRSVSIRRRAVLMISVCDDCWDRHDLDRFASEVFPDWSEEAFAQLESMKAEACCRECVAAVDLSTARAKGLAEPFAAYEHTLTFLQQEDVEQLRTTLLQTFDFQRSVVREGATAMWVEAGALTYPLTITVYYVTAPRIQDAILEVIDRFVLERSRPQYRARFYRAEDWGPDPKFANVTRRGTEELLRQVDRGLR